MAMWRSKKEAAAGAASGAAPVCVVRSAGAGKIPKGYVPMVLVGDEGEGEESRVLVHVRMLTEPRVLALLEMSAQQFGYGQRGVLRVPCGVERFQQTVRAGHRRETRDPACAAAH